MSGKSMASTADPDDVDMDDTISLASETSTGKTTPPPWAVGPPQRRGIATYMHVLGAHDRCID